MRDHRVFTGVVTAALPWVGPVVMGLAGVGPDKWPIVLFWPALYLVLGLYFKSATVPREARELRDGPVYRAFLRYGLLGNFALGWLIVFEFAAAGRSVPGIGGQLSSGPWTAAAVLAYLGFLALSLVGQHHLRQAHQLLASGKSRLWRA
jgi:hypothetical protein